MRGQPLLPPALLPTVARALGTTPRAIGLTPMLTQAGYGAGMLLFVALALLGAAAARGALSARSA